MLISNQDIKYLCRAITQDVAVQKKREQTTKRRACPLHEKNICSYKVSYTTQFGYLAVWEASEVLTSIGH